jgi:hypothetical protein
VIAVTSPVQRFQWVLADQNNGGSPVNTLARTASTALLVSLLLPAAIPFSNGAGHAQAQRAEQQVQLPLHLVLHEPPHCAGQPHRDPDLVESGTLDTPAFVYRASYKIEGRTLKIHREFISRVGSQSCPADLEPRIAKEMSIVGGNVRNVFEFAAPVVTPQPRKDSITVEIIWPSGRSFKRRYAIEVKAVENVSNVPNATSPL